MLRTVKLGVVFGAVALFTNTAEAATIFFTPAVGEFNVGGEISVDLKIDSEGVGLNATQATLRFPKDMLTVKSIDKNGSTFNFWLEEPTFSNTDGVISFIGGTPYGISGSSLQVVHIVFTSQGVGSAQVTIADAAATASDGSGTNILSKTSNAVFTISPTSTTPTPVVPAPRQIVREATPVSNLPSRPSVAVTLYPDPTLWYDVSNIFNAKWDLPRDISGVSTSINKNPNFNQTEESDGLFDSKSFATLSDGTWYLHVRFQNNIGWGPTAHYRIAIDTQTPVPFTITSSEGEVNDNPTPTLTFKTSDSLSGLADYRIKIDNIDWITLPKKDFKGTFKLPATGPGKHHITVEARDLAGNSVENTIDLEILPIASPTFTFVTESLFSDEAKGLTAKGTATPSTEIILLLKKGSETISSAVTPVDAHGNWEFTFGDPLRNGSYVISVQNRDSRGALSLTVDSTKISVTGKYTNIIITLIAVLSGALFGGAWYYERRRERTALRINVAESDASKVFKMIESDIEKLNKARGTTTSVDDEFIIKKMQEDVNKMGGYIKEEIKKAGK